MILEVRLILWHSKGTCFLTLWLSDVMLLQTLSCMHYLSTSTNLQGLAFVLLVPFLKFGIELGQSKQAVNSLFLKIDPSWTLGIQSNSNFVMYVVEILPQIALMLVVYILYRCILCRCAKGALKYVTFGTILSYLLISLMWALDSSLLRLPSVLGCLKGNLIPQIIYAISFLQLLFLAAVQPFIREKYINCEESTIFKASALLCSWSAPIIVLSGKQGPLVALASIIAGTC